MADGPVANLPPNLDAYAGYINQSGIGITYLQIVAKFPNALHLSITTNGSAALCADVESGAMKNWLHYSYGYCDVFNVNELIKLYGRPRKLWTAHYDPNIGPHICSPRCWPGLVTTADGTQWTDHGNQWDESLLANDFFTLNPVPNPTPEPDMPMPYIVKSPSSNAQFIVAADWSSKTLIASGEDGSALLNTHQIVGLSLTDAQLNAIPNA